MVALFYTYYCFFKASVQMLVKVVSISKLLRGLTPKHCLEINTAFLKGKKCLELITIRKTASYQDILERWL